MWSLVLLVACHRPARSPEPDGTPPVETTPLPSGNGSGDAAATGNAAPTPDTAATDSGTTTPPVVYEHLPVLLIATDAHIPDGTKAPGTLEVIRDHDGTLTDLETAPRSWVGPIGIEIHGSSSSGYPKLSYAFETRDDKGEDLDVPLLDFPEESDWILTANYGDPTLLRNAVEFALARATREPSGHWEPRTAFAEVFLNETYEGVYLVTEKVKRGPNRVDIDSPDDTPKGDLTGGYIVNVDQNRGVGWQTKRGTPLDYVYPHWEDFSAYQFEYLWDWWNGFEDVMAGASPLDAKVGYPAWLDRPSFVDHYILNELAHNVDAYRLSTYLYKEADDDGGLLYAGPVWDFDRSYGNVGYCDCSKPEGFIIDDLTTCGYGYEFPFWWDQIRSDPAFQDSLRCRWDELRATVMSDDAIDAVISDLAAEIAEAQARDEAVWHTTADFHGDVQSLRVWVKERTTWLDANMPGSCGP